MLTGNEIRILKLFAEGDEASLTKYAIAESLGLGSSSVQHIVNKLTERNLIQVSLSNKWRTGRIRRELNLTFVGTIFYLSMLEAKKNRKNKEFQETVRNSVKSQGSRLKYAPFTEFDEIDQAVRQVRRTGQTGFTPIEALCSIAGQLLEHVVQFAPCEWNDFTFRSRGLKYVKGIPLPDNIKAEVKEKQEDAWKDGFARLLLNIDLQHQCPRVWTDNPTLSMFYENMLSRQEETLQKELEGIRNDRIYVRGHRDVRAVQKAT